LTRIIRKGHEVRPYGIERTTCDGPSLKRHSCDLN
jgi:hypothetical protein